jgi:hypothetical protein
VPELCSGGKLTAAAGAQTIGHRGEDAVGQRVEEAGAFDRTGDLVGEPWSMGRHARLLPATRKIHTATGILTLVR